ncbi:hypothetical protein BDY17DRAFT_321454 [Neohortaea acidophila]|uniref:RING-type domain-containing protein n=1 Tax=Neohortaea acidophila TaxID=245834 RepID=A0A6A6Q3Q7_9PEZI|nr:uncharacterized protein BDY17DRAFT_321454 [Neohortaea acidophila]KAF2486681.1 hypothetical protein BDY17DRAFT_321454 [Neohortaea acidophila]
MSSTKDDMRGRQCVWCWDTKTEQKPHLVDEHFLCLDCVRMHIVPSLENALQHEHHYPPKAGAMIFDPAAFEDLLGPEFLERYREKEVEYKLPITERIYCAHNILRTLGDETPLNMLDVVDPGEKRPERCNAFVGQKVADADTEPDPCEGLTRGVDYQQCPNCKKVVQLMEACNEITCFPGCLGHFCFICGSDTGKGPSDHWVRGGCPRYNSAGAANARYDLSDEEAAELRAELTTEARANGVTWADTPGEDPVDGQYFLGLIRDGRFIDRTINELAPLLHAPAEQHADDVSRKRIIAIAGQMFLITQTLMVIRRLELSQLEKGLRFARGAMQNLQSEAENVPGVDWPLYFPLLEIARVRLLEMQELQQRGRKALIEARRGTIGMDEGSFLQPIGGDDTTLRTENAQAAEAAKARRQGLRDFAERTLAEFEQAREQDNEVGADALRALRSVLTTTLQQLEMLERLAAAPAILIPCYVNFLTKSMDRTDGELNFIPPNFHQLYNLPGSISRIIEKHHEDVRRAVNLVSAGLGRLRSANQGRSFGKCHQQ